MRGFGALPSPFAALYEALHGPCHRHVDLRVHLWRLRHGQPAPRARGDQPGPPAHPRERPDRRPRRQRVGCSSSPRSAIILFAIGRGLAAFGQTVPRRDGRPGRRLRHPQRDLRQPAVAELRLPRQGPDRPGHVPRHAGRREHPHVPRPWACCACSTSSCMLVVAVVGMFVDQLAARPRQHHHAAVHRLALVRAGQHGAADLDRGAGEPSPRSRRSPKRRSPASASSRPSAARTSRARTSATPPQQQADLNYKASQGAGDATSRCSWASASLQIAISVGFGAC